MQCTESNCTRDAIATGRFCTVCFQTKWGPNPIEHLPLPSCLTRIVKGYFAFTSEDCARNWELLYLTSHMCSEMDIAFVFKAMLEFESSDPKVIDFIADRYCRAAGFWGHVRRWCGDPYEDILNVSLNAARVFEPYHPVVLTSRLLKQSQRQHNDAMLWWIVNLENIELPFINDTTFTCLFARIIDWQSMRLLQRFIEMGLFSIVEIADIFLKTAITRNNLPMFLDVWNIYYEDVFEHRHALLLTEALDRCYFPILDFFSSLKGAAVMGIYFLIRKLNCNANLRSWLIRNKHMTPPDLARHPDLNSEFLLEFWDAGLFGTVYSESLTDMILFRGDIYRLIIDHVRHVPQAYARLLALLSRMTHLGTQDQLQITSRRMCKCLSLSEFQEIYTLPIVQKHVTFAVLRSAHPDFLFQIVANGCDLATLDWFGSMRDNEQQTLLLRDVYAKNKVLLRFARKKDNRELQDWIAKFTRDHVVFFSEKKNKKK